jgi:N-acetylmuramoyl-L-alanine amidase
MGGDCRRQECPPSGGPDEIASFAALPNSCLESCSSFPKMVGMRNWAGSSGLILLCLWLSSCAHSSQPNARTRVPDWEAEEIVGAQMQTNPNVESAITGTNTTPRGLTAQPTPPLEPDISLRLSNSAAVPITRDRNAWVPLQSWCRQAELSPALRLSGTASTAFEVRGTNGILFLHPGSHSALWEGVELRLGFAPTLIDGHPFLHALDLKKTVEPLLFSSRIHVAASKPVIVIDPGHGGENAGTRSAVGAHFEKDFTLDWAKRLAQVLESQGWAVFLTRTGDNNLALSNRVSFADSHKAELFISLHFNSAGPAESESGLETYCLTPVGMPSTVTRGFGDERDARFPNNGWDAQNLRLAYAVHDALLRSTGMHDRGIRRARFPGVLRHQNRPAILVEGGYLSNAAEARRIAEPQFRQQLAEGVAGGLTTIWHRDVVVAPVNSLSRDDTHAK